MEKENFEKGQYCFFTTVLFISDKLYQMICSEMAVELLQNFLN